MNIKLTNCDEYTTVSPQHFEHLSQFKWYKNKYGYAHSTIKTKTWSLHRYILVILEKEEIQEDFVIDHRDNDKLNNTIENINTVSRSENSRNRTKILNTSSNFYGVSKDKRTKKWRAHVHINNKDITEQYVIEEHAAHARDLLVTEHKLKGSKTNDISPDFLQDFTRYVKKTKTLPVGINKKGEKYRVEVNNKYYGIFKDLDDAIAKMKQVRTQNKLDKENAILTIPIKRNKKGECIIELFNKHKEKVAETIVDEELYYNLIKFNWSFSNYVQGKVNGKKIRLHRHVMQYNGPNIIDHKDGNPLNNKKSNLRVVTARQNNQNRSSNKESSSKYVGISFDKNTEKWWSRIKSNGKSFNLGQYGNEEDAARVRDVATIKHFGEYGNLNFPIVPK